MKTSPPFMPDDGTQFPGSNPRRMANGKACDPVSPGFRRGLFVSFPRVKLRARLRNARHQNSRLGLQGHLPPLKAASRITIHAAGSPSMAAAAASMAAVSGVVSNRPRPKRVWARA